MAQAFADAIGASKRQVQHWTDRGAIKCIPATDQQGRGKQRHYDEEEIPIARLVAQMAAFQLPIGRLVWMANAIRSQVQHGSTEKGTPGGFPASWHRKALAGGHESYLVLRASRGSIMWTDRKGRDDMLEQIAAFVIPVHIVNKRVPR